MTREEALERLEGTWSFEIQDRKVLIREASLIAAVEAIRRERPLHRPATVPRPAFVAAAWSG